MYTAQQMPVNQIVLPRSKLLIHFPACTRPRTLAVYSAIYADATRDRPQSGLGATCAVNFGMRKNIFLKNIIGEKVQKEGKANMQKQGQQDQSQFKHKYTHAHTCTRSILPLLDMEMLQVSAA